MGRAQVYAQKKGRRKEIAPRHKPRGASQVATPSNGRRSPGKMGPDFESVSKGTKSPLDLVKQPAGFRVPGSQNAFASSPCPMAVWFDEKRRARYFPGIAHLLRKWGNRLPQASKPTMSGDKSTNVGAKLPRQRHVAHHFAGGVHFASRAALRQFAREIGEAAET